MTGEMQDLLGKYFSGEATASEVKEVEQWVAADEDNRREFALQEQLWQRSGDGETVSFDTDKAWESVHARLNPAIAPAKKIGISRALIGIAASVLLILGFWWWSDRDTAMNSVFADAGVKEVVLKDGSRVFLRKGATFTYPDEFTSGSREVTLDGQAFFDVVSNPDKPFVITAADARVQVLGTSFSVNTNNKQVELVVKTGRVNFSPLAQPAKRIMVVAGERALFTGGSISKTTNTDNNFDAWQTGKIEFAGTPLRDVLRTLSEYYGVVIRLRKDQPEQLLGTGITISFNNQSLESVLQEFEMITALRVEKLNDTEYEVSKE